MNHSITLTRQFERQLGDALDRLAAAGYVETAEALAAHARERRGRVRGGAPPIEIGARLLDLLAEVLALGDLAQGGEIRPRGAIEGPQ